MRYLTATLLLLALLTAGGSSLPPPPTEPTPWQTFSARPPRGPTLTLQAVGDVMLARGIAELSARHGVDWPFSVIGRDAPLALLGADLVLANLESPLTDLPPVREGPYRFAAPPAAAAALARAGFTHLSLANNHALDAGPAGLAQSVTLVREHGLTALGAADGAASARRPLLIERNGLRLALFAANAVSDPADRPDEGTDWGRAWLDDALLAEISAAAAANDVVIVMPHWGEEYLAAPSPAQQAWAARLTAAGADLIIGSHPHVLQPISWVEAGGRRALVAYSLGNFVFDQPGRFVTSSSAVLQITLDADGVAAAAVAPVDALDGRVFPLDAQTAQGRAVLAALALPTPAAAQVADAVHPTLRAWRWDGIDLLSVPVPRTTRLPAVARQQLIDLFGDGIPRWARLDDADILRVSAFDTPDTLLWQNELPDWRVLRIASGDLNRDGRPELTLLLQRREPDGRLVQQPYLLGVRDGRIAVIWGGSPTTPALQDLAVADLDGDSHDELVMLLGGAAPGDRVEQLVVAQWERWVFLTTTLLPLDGARNLRIDDIDGDGRPEVLVDR